MFLKQNSKNINFLFFSSFWWFFRSGVVRISLLCSLFSTSHVFFFFWSEKKTCSKEELNLSDSLQTFRECSSHEYFDSTKFQCERISIEVRRAKKPLIFCLTGNNFPWLARQNRQIFKNGTTNLQNHQLQLVVTPVSERVRQKNWTFLVVGCSEVSI